MKAQVFLWLSLISISSAAGNARKSGASEMLKKIQEIGIQNEIDALYSNQEQWKKLLSGISKADSGWISVGLVLYDSADAAASDAITQALGESLEINPAKAFHQIRSLDMIPSICAAPDVHVTKYNSYVKTMKAIEKRIKILQGIKQPDLQPKSTACSEELEKAKGGVRKFFRK